MAEIAVQGMSFTCSANGTYQVITPPDSNVSIDNKSAYFGNVDVMVMSGATQGGGTLTAPVTITLKATGSNVTTEKGNALLKGDQQQAPVNGNFQVGQATVSMPITMSVKDAGQTNVTAS